MMHAPRTIKAALLTGFLVVFGVWLASMAYFTEHLANAHERNAAIHARYARGQDLLFAIRSQVLVGSIYLRDALVSANRSTTEVPASDHLRTLQMQVDQELEQYKAIDPADESADWMRFEDELRDYWDAAVRLATLEPDNRMEAESRLQTE